MGENRTPNLFTLEIFLSCLNRNFASYPSFQTEELIAAGEDPDDQGGYFVVNGSERVIVAMEDLAPNRVLVDIDEKGTSPVYQAKIFSTTVGFRARIELKLKSDDAIYVTMPGLPTEIPFVVIMRALSLEKDKDIAEAVSLDSEMQSQLAASFEKAIGVDTPADAILFIGNRVAHGQVEEYRLQKAETALDKNFLPHLRQKRSEPKGKSNFPRRNGIQSFTVENGQKAT